MKTLQGKRALVTGAASGIGRAIALGLAREGVRLILLDIDVVGLGNIGREVQSLGSEPLLRICDLRQPSEISECLRDVINDGGIDILVNNAGVATYGPTEQMSAEQWDRVLAVNLLAPIQIVRELLPSLLERDEAHIVNVCSLAGLVAGSKLAAYNVSKFGLQGLSETLRAEYGRSGLGVTSLCPGFAPTNIYEAANQNGSPQHVEAPKAWMMTTADHIAARAIRGIRRNQPIVVVTMLAHVLWFLKRLAPRLFLRFFTSRFRRSKPAALTAAEAKRLSA